MSSSDDSFSNDFVEYEDDFEDLDDSLFSKLEIEEAFERLNSNKLRHPQEPVSTDQSIKDVTIGNALSTLKWKSTKSLQTTTEEKYHSYLLDKVKLQTLQLKMQRVNCLHPI
jgi:hypothetical protein